MFEQVLGRVRALGFVTKRGKQRTDSLAVLGAVRRLSALETVTETRRLAVRALAQGEEGVAWLAQEVPASFVDGYVDLRPDYRLSAPDQAALARQVGLDGFWLLARLDATAPAALAAREERRCRRCGACGRSASRSGTARRRCGRRRSLAPTSS